MCKSKQTEPLLHFSKVPCRMSWVAELLASCLRKSCPFSLSQHGGLFFLTLKESFPLPPGSVFGFSVSWDFSSYSFFLRPFLALAHSALPQIALGDNRWSTTSAYRSLPYFGTNGEDPCLNEDAFTQSWRCHYRQSPKLDALQPGSCQFSKLYEPPTFRDIVLQSLLSAITAGLLQSD